MRSTTWALVAALLLAASPAFAGGGERGDWELGVYGGYGWLDDYGWLDPKDDLLYGARLGYFFTPHWSLGLSAQRQPTETDSVGGPSRDVELSSARLNLAFNMAPGSRIRPFLTAGGGLERVDVDPGGIEKNDFGWNAGGGLHMFITPNWNLRADGRFVQVQLGEPIDEPQNNIEATLGLSYVFGGSGDAEPEPPAAPMNQPPLVSCVTDRSEILPGESVSLRATASDPDGDPLTYEWITTAGRLSGNGTTATLDFTGATPPANATVTVRVSDSKGMTASSDCSVRLVEPVRQAESVSCLAGGFPRNLSRLTNVDKACLDDVAQRLKADPRARVIVIGHADSRERATSTIAEARATAVKDYLAEAGIEASRVTVRSSGSTKPLDTGTDVTAQSRNRRVEVWFVPEGATPPPE
jgi:outer membrane protein OmpA-like peptidoglycan-associated protein/opacity protein-like surface antigen